MSMDAGPPSAPRRPGRRPGTGNSREAILDAARTRFAQDGYSGATIRKIAADAGVDASQVMQFFGSKEQLFAAVMSFTPGALERMAAAVDGPRDSLGERVARAYLGVWESESPDSEPMLAMLRGAVSSEAASEQLRGFLQARLTDGRDDREPNDHEKTIRLGIAAAMMVGVMVSRRIVKVPALADEDFDALISRIAPALQVLLVG